LPTESIQPEIPSRLPFTLPEFTRVSWVDDDVRNTWEPRLARVNAAWRQLEWASVAVGLRPCALLWLSPSDRDGNIEQWRRYRLSALSLDGFSESSGLTITVVGRRLDDVHEFRKAWQGQDHDAVGGLLGYPRCCRRMFASFWVTGATDPTWAAACATEGVKRSGRTAIVSGNDNANFLWRWLGVRAVPHLPCSFACIETAQIGERMLDIGRAAGFAQEMAWLCECLTWPIEYSALHGIAEIKTPILRVATRTDATAEKYIVRLAGNGFPQDGARGLHFPYRVPTQVTIRRKKADDEQDTPTSAAKAEWYFKENGFTSLEAMTNAHRPLIELACRTLREQTGNILDLGSGNGALLSAICARCAPITPFGVEINSAAVKHAPGVLHSLAKIQASVGEIRQGDLFDANTWRDRDYVLAILMLGRLTERQEIAKEFLRTLSHHCRTLLVYLYPDWTTFSLNDLAAEHGLILDSAHKVHISGTQIGVAHFPA
jgi:hypothetical protein